MSEPARRHPMPGAPGARARTITLLGALVGALSLACNVTPAPVPVVAERADLTALAGTWSGEYGSEETGRSGSILFTLEAGTDTAHGDVVMIPSRFNEPLRRADLGPEHRTRPHSELLTIRFVRIEGGRVSGMLDPYRDPVCECPIETTFTGRLVSDDTIEGTFVTTGPPGHRTTTGRWRVTRSS